AVDWRGGVGNLALVAQCPVAERGHRLQQIAPERSQAVFDPRRNGGKYAARNQPVTFEATQRQRQHALRNAADRPAQFVEPQRSAAKPRHHQNRPLVADPGEHVAHRAAVRGQMLVSRFHGCAFLAGSLWVTYLALVTTCQYRSCFLAFRVTSAYRKYPPHYLRFPPSIRYLSLALGNIQLHAFCCPNVAQGEGNDQAHQV